MPWRVVVPIKTLDAAKTRLQVPDGIRSALALAFALDAIDALRKCDQVASIVVTTNSDDLSAELTRQGIEVMVDSGVGLNAAIRGAATSEVDTAVLVGDLPAVQADDLTSALTTAAAHRRSFVCDATGVGTTLLTARAGTPLDPRFGEHSRAEHRASGAHEIDGRFSGLRRDVDTDVDLWDARRLGVGAHTQAVLAAVLG